MRSLGISAPASMTVDEFAGRYGVSLRALRVYERLGLLIPPRRDGAPVYGPRERLRLEVILRAEKLEIPLFVLKDLIDGMKGDIRKQM